MKTITLLKTITVVMAFLIVIGFISVVYKLAEKRQKIKSSSVVHSEMLFDFAENVKEMSPCGEMLCLMTEGNSLGKRLIVINPQIGRVSGIITFKEKTE